MGSTPLFVIPLFLSLASSPLPSSATKVSPPLPRGDLGAEDAVYLEYLLQELLFDPKSSERVRASASEQQFEDAVYPRRSRNGGDAGARPGWLVRGKNGEPDRVYFADGESITAPFKRIEFLDFELDCRRRYGVELEALDEDFTRVLRRQLLTCDDTDLALAAWLHRRGCDSLAARALEQARRREFLHDDLRSCLALHAYESMRRAMRSHADAVALAHGQRLLRLYPDQLEVDFPQARMIVADLKRRQHAGTLGAVPGKEWPKGFEEWDTRKKVAHLIDSLDQIAPAPLNRGIASEWSVDEDRRFRALLAIGDAAIPALIDAMETDSRLTRCLDWDEGLLRCHSGLREGRGRPMVTVRDVAEHLVDDILRVRDLEPHRMEERIHTASAKTSLLRAYWLEFGHLPFDDRMMATLNDRKARPQARRRAAVVLVESSETLDASWSNRDLRPSNLYPGPGPLVRKFKSPSVAESILAAMEDERAREADAETSARSREDFEEQYIRCLADLGDPRVGPELARRAATCEHLDRRILYARAANRLGCSGPMIALAREVHHAEIVLVGQNSEFHRVRELAPQRLGEVLTALIGSGLREADEALYSLAEATTSFFQSFWNLPWTKMACATGTQPSDDIRSSPMSWHGPLPTKISREETSTRGTVGSRWIRIRTSARKNSRSCSAKVSDTSSTQRNRSRTWLPLVCTSS
jgi:hypothetical protein